MSLQIIIVIVAVMGLLIGAAAMRYARRGVIPPRLVMSDGQVRPCKFTGRMTVGDNKETRDIDLSIFGFAIEIAPLWDEIGETSRPLEVGLFVENQGPRTAKAVKILVPHQGQQGFTVLLKDSDEVEFLPSEPLRKGRLEGLQCKNLGDIGPGIKHPVTLVFKFPPLPELRALLKTYHPAVWHDYYLSADDLECQSKLMWINLSLLINGPTGNPGFQKRNLN